MKYRLTLLVFCCALALQAQMEMNVDQLAEFIRSELALKQHTDKQIAAYLKKIRLTEQLPDKTVQDLEAQGAGPKTVNALKALEQQSANFKRPAHEATYSPATAQETSPASPPQMSLGAKGAPIPPPNSVRQAEILDEIKQYASTYTENLPNFLCLQVTRRYIDPRATDDYHLIDTVTSQLSYNQGHENYRVMSVNGKLMNVGLSLAEATAKSGGAISTGEFGSLMRSIFDPRSDAQFNWDHWGTLRGKRMAVFHYAIDSGHSDYHITYDNDLRIITAYDGKVYADEYTGAVSRITFDAVDIPKTFPVTEAHEILDYDDVTINGQPYMVPLKATVRMKADHAKTRNDIEFRLYRKFGTESTITYGEMTNATSQPLPASQTEEQTAPQQQQPAEAANPKPTSGSDPFALPSPPPPPPSK